MLLMMNERMLYRTRTNKKWSNEPQNNVPDIENSASGFDYWEAANHTLMIKMIVYFILAVAVHI